MQANILSARLQSSGGGRLFDSDARETQISVHVLARGERSKRGPVAFYDRSINARPRRPITRVWRSSLLPFNYSSRATAGQLALSCCTHARARARVYGRLMRFAAEQRRASADRRRCRSLRLLP